MLSLGEKDSLSSKDFMPSLPGIMSTKPHCKATFSLHPRSFINTVQDQPVFSAHSSMKSYVSFHLANTRTFIRGQRGLERSGPTAVGQLHGSRYLNALHYEMPGTVLVWCKQAHSLKWWVCWMRGSGGGSQQTKQRPGRGTDCKLS